MAALGCRRDLFPDLDQSRLYLSGAGRSPLPRCVLEVGMQAIKLKAVTPWSIGDTARNLARIKQLFAQFIGAAPADIALTPSTSYAISLAAKNLAGVFTTDRTDIIVVEDQVENCCTPTHSCSRALPVHRSQPSKLLCGAENASVAYTDCRASYTVCMLVAIVA